MANFLSHPMCCIVSADMRCAATITALHAGQERILMYRKWPTSKPTILPSMQPSRRSHTARESKQVSSGSSHNLLCMLPRSLFMERNERRMRHTERYKPSYHNTNTLAIWLNLITIEGLRFPWPALPDLPSLRSFRAYSRRIPEPWGGWPRPDASIVRVLNRM